MRTFTFIYKDKQYSYSYVDNTLIEVYDVDHNVIEDLDISAYAKSDLIQNLCLYKDYYTGENV